MADPSGIPDQASLRPASAEEFKAYVTDAYVLTRYPGVATSHPALETYAINGRYERRVRGQVLVGAYSFHDGVVCALDSADAGRRRCSLVLTDGKGRFFRQPVRSDGDLDRNGPPGELRVQRPGPPA